MAFFLRFFAIYSKGYRQPKYLANNQSLSEGCLLANLENSPLSSPAEAANAVK